MEPVTTTIVAAVVAGAVAATQEVASQAIKDAYQGLKGLIVKRLGKKADVEEALEKVEARPDSEARQAVLQEEMEMAQADEDAEVVAKARELLALLKREGAAAGTSYRAELHGDGAIAQGSGAVAAGKGGVAVGGNVQGGVHVGGQEEDET
jgi:beta-phosphoglucomutase-like phosphatase (HAD superfamily)